MDLPVWTTGLEPCPPIRGPLDRSPRNSVLPSKSLFNGHVPTALASSEPQRRGKEDTGTAVKETGCAALWGATVLLSPALDDSEYFRIHFQSLLTSATQLQLRRTAAKTEAAFRCDPSVDASGPSQAKARQGAQLAQLARARAD
jgi:hypothetical protein